MSFQDFAKFSFSGLYRFGGSRHNTALNSTHFRSALRFFRQCVSYRGRAMVKEDPAAIARSAKVKQSLLLSTLVAVVLALGASQTSAQQRPASGPAVAIV